tara:strand:- start:261 stop:542 length:282 start_codon:yes stop_codon:yes gene_type:complete
MSNIREIPTKKYSITITETKRMSVEVPRSLDIKTFNWNEFIDEVIVDDIQQTFTPIRDDSEVDYNLADTLEDLIKTNKVKCYEIISKEVNTNV